MKPVKLFLLFLSIIILNNCSPAHKVKIDAVASPDQMIDYDGVVTSEKEHTVSLAYYDFVMLNDKTKFMIIVENYGDKPIDFSNDNISVMFEGNSVDWSYKKIEIEKPSDVMMDLQNRIRMQFTIAKRTNTEVSGFGSVLPNSAAMSSLSSISGGGSFTPRKSVNDRYSDAKEMAQNSIQAKKRHSYYAIPRVIIQPQIIMPNESISGFFVCDTSKMKNNVKGNFIISVRAGDEEHKFIFSRS